MNIKRFLTSYIGWLVLVTLLCMTAWVNFTPEVTGVKFSLALIASIATAIWLVCGLDGILAISWDFFPGRHMMIRIGLTIVGIIGGPITLVKSLLRPC